MSTRISRKTGLIAAALLLSTGLAAGADRDFKDIVRAISDHYGTRPLRIPFFGLVNAFTFVARPAGTKHIDLAVFDDLRGSRMDPGVLDRIVGNRWKPFVRVRSNRSGECTMIYMQPNGNDTKVLIATMERNEATVVQLELDVDTLQRWLAHPEHANWAGNRGRNRDRDWDRDRESERP